MADNEEYSSESDDEDYVPSAEESDEQLSDINEENDDENEESTNSKKRKKTAGKHKSRKRRGQIFEDELVEENGSKAASEAESEKEKVNEVKEKVNEVKEKAHADALWSSFLADTKPKSKPVTGSGLGSLCSTKVPSVEQKSTPEANKTKITVTKEYNFAGEVVSVEEKIDIDSKEAKNLTFQESSPKTQTPSASSAKKPAGLGSILSKIQGKPKMSTLEKSRLDWCQFKTEQGIEEELQTHNKGKDGYIEKQAFLQRADLRQFEIERNMRMTNRSKR